MAFPYDYVSTGKPWQSLCRSEDESDTTDGSTDSNTSDDDFINLPTYSRRSSQSEMSVSNTTSSDQSEFKCTSENLCIAKKKLSAKIKNKKRQTNPHGENPLSYCNNELAARLWNNDQIRKGCFVLLYKDNVKLELAKRGLSFDDLCREACKIKPKQNKTVNKHISNRRRRSVRQSQGEEKCSNLEKTSDSFQKRRIILRFEKLPNSENYICSFVKNNEKKSLPLHKPLNENSETETETETEIQSQLETQQESQPEPDSESVSESESNEKHKMQSKTESELAIGLPTVHDNTPKSNQSPKMVIQPTTELCFDSSDSSMPNEDMLSQLNYISTNDGQMNSSDSQINQNELCSFANIEQLPVKNDEWQNDEVNIEKLLGPNDKVVETFIESSKILGERSEHVSDDIDTIIDLLCIDNDTNSMSKEEFSCEELENHFNVLYDGSTSCTQKIGTQAMIEIKTEEECNDNIRKTIEQIELSANEDYIANSADSDSDVSGISLFAPSLSDICPSPLHKDAHTTIHSNISNLSKFCIPQFNRIIKPSESCSDIGKNQAVAENTERQNVLEQKQWDMNNLSRQYASRTRVNFSHDHLKQSDVNTIGERSNTYLDDGKRSVSNFCATDNSDQGKLNERESIMRNANSNLNLRGPFTEHAPNSSNLHFNTRPRSFVHSTLGYRNENQSNDMTRTSVCSSNENLVSKVDNIVCSNEQQPNSLLDIATLKSRSDQSTPLKNTQFMETSKFRDNIIVVIGKTNNRNITIQQPCTSTSTSTSTNNSNVNSMTVNTIQSIDHETNVKNDQNQIVPTAFPIQRNTISENMPVLQFALDIMDKDKRINYRNRLTSLLDRPCFLFLDNKQCSHLCKFNHKLPPIHIVAERMAPLKNEIVQFMYSEFIVKNPIIFEQYFPLICQIYANRMMRTSLVLLIKDCEKHNKYDFFCNIFNALTQCGLNKKDALLDIVATCQFSKTTDDVIIKIISTDPMSFIEILCTYLKRMKCSPQLIGDILLEIVEQPTNNNLKMGIDLLQQIDGTIISIDRQIVTSFCNVIYNSGDLYLTKEMVNILNSSTGNSSTTT